MLRKEQIANNFKYYLAYKFRNLFFVLAFFLLFYAFAENLLYLGLAVFFVILGVVAHSKRNELIKKVKKV